MNPEIYLTPSGLLVRNVDVMTKFVIVSNEFLSSVEFPELVSVLADINLAGNVDLVSVVLPALVDVGTLVRAGFNTSNCPLLTTILFPNYLPTKGKTLNFTGCALSEASVDHVLARCVASTTFVVGRVMLEGGTNSPPSAAGLADKATLIARGVIVTTN